jgi:hypothetical protein
LLLGVISVSEVDSIYKKGNKKHNNPLLGIGENGCKKRHIVAGISLLYRDDTTGSSCTWQGFLYTTGRREILEKYG